MVKKKVPEFSFTDQNGKTITNKDYSGKVYVVEFFFTTCPTICPKMNANLIQTSKIILKIIKMILELHHLLLIQLTIHQKF